MQAHATRSAKARTRSVQLDKSVDMATNIADAESARDLSMPPVPSARSSSLPSGKENNASIRHYRSMLDVEGPPKLGPLKPFTCDELYVDNTKMPSSPPQVPFGRGICTCSAWF